ncbi:MAG: mannose-1-phosphate guanylyltransferase/mannose-6-phosphate isomerase [Chlorobium sp.]|uniref:mannose-1-phosphate guanylyltransferase/mannose-6-phosphate isomerase n=1 Tax=Chlorobium sp. TaxID=1095 RepID=UPI002F3F6C08
MIIPVILSGGAGTRLWPLSRALYPKQLLPLMTDKTMLQETVLRLGALDNVGPVCCICNEQHRFLVAEQLHAVTGNIGGIILEPAGRNTAPAAAVAALHALSEHELPILLLLPADHVIRDAEAFARAVSTGYDAAAAGALVTFGIVPAGPETGYGYIRAQAGGETSEGAFPVLEFVEKPDRVTAERYIASGGYYWNSGMFLFRADVFLRELEQLNPEMLALCRRAFESAAVDLDFLRLDSSAFTACPADSIDYAVMEKTSRAVVVPLDAGWNDVGAWSALWELNEHDDASNVLKGDVLVEDVRDSYIHATSRLVGAVGVDNLIIVETPDAVLVSSRDKVQEVKSIVRKLQDSKRVEAETHRRVYRPWGSYETVDLADRFQVKRIIVKPGAALSLQKHFHRAEHWIVVKGTAQITVGDRQITLGEDQSTYIPLGSLHRLENPGKIPLELIEVQTGSYLGEDDIVRIDDRYGRIPDSGAATVR